MHLFLSLFALAYLTSEVGKQNILGFEAVSGAGGRAMSASRVYLDMGTDFCGDMGHLEQFTLYRFNTALIIGRLNFTLTHGVSRISERINSDTYECGRRSFADTAVGRWK